MVMDEGVKQIMKGMNKNSTLRALFLVNSYLGCKGAIYVASTLSCNITRGFGSQRKWNSHIFSREFGKCSGRKK